MQTRPSTTGQTMIPQTEVRGQAPSSHSWIFRRTVLPVLALLRLGSSPERLAWSIAAGALIGINPVLGSTTVLCLAAAVIFRLNVPASQIGTHLMYPLELALVLPFLHLGTRIFGTAPLTLGYRAILDAARHAPLELVRKIWMWEWHALIVWCLVAAVAVPVLAGILTPILRRLLVRVRCGGVPSISTL